MPARSLSEKKAPLVGAFFVIGLYWLPAQAQNCAPPPQSHGAQIGHVHDGDTVTLDDNTRVRLIGINAPEVAHDGKPAQPLANRARDQLRALLREHGNRVTLLDGRQPQDQYGRTLAHLWLPDGTDVTAELLVKGLGWLVAIPPNTRFIECRKEAEAQARKARRGVWAEGVYAAQPSDSLSPRTGGFQRVRGQVTRVSRGGGATWVNLEGDFAIRIPDQDLKEFTERPSARWIGRELEVRGWVYKVRGQLRVTVGHPANLQLL
ncbi:MAG: thermonuclease family protein [Thiogranum sp.]